MTVTLAYQLKDIYSLPKQKLDSDTVIVGVDGICYIVTDEGNLQFGIDSIIYIPRGVEFSVRSAVGFSGIFIEVAGECPMKPLTPLMDYTKNTVPLAEMIHASYTQNGEGSSLTEALLSSVMGYAEIISEKKGEPDFISMLKARIASEYHSKDFDLVRECLRLGYNHDYVRRVFRTVVGKTPSDFLTDVRISRAKELLVSTPDLPIADIASATGFSDQYYFSRVFSKMCGISPARYRRARLNGEA